MVDKREYITKKRLGELKMELQHLRTIRRQEVADRILQAKDLGGTEDNAEFDDAKNEQAFIEGRILTLDNIIHNAVIISEKKSSSGVVEVGTRVTIQEQSSKPVKYLIVGSAEADPKAGRISNESPVGMALIGRKVGDTVEVKVPAGVVKLIIKDIK